MDQLHGTAGIGHADVGAAGAKPADGLPERASDAVLADLGDAVAHYHAFRARFQHQAEELRVMQRALQREREELARQKRRTERYRDRADHFRASLKEIHRSLFAGDVFALVLRSCLQLTGARRGLYVGEREGRLRVRAAAAVDGYPGAPPSPFVEALCRRVLERHDAVVLGDADTRDLPRPTREAERFATCAAVPVVVRGEPHGVMIIADKAHGQFDEDDVESLLHIGDQAGIAIENSRLHAELEHAYVGTVCTLADAVEAKDPYIHGHCRQVSHLARQTARRLDLDAETCSIVCFAGLLHDIGKIAVSDGILNKPGPLLPEERVLVQAHVRIGHDLLSNLPGLHPVASIVLHHHECWDGTGYPQGLRGDAIPIGARIVAAVDAYCAMIDRRAYKPAFSDGQARVELRRCAGTQFDPAVVDALLAVLDSPDAAHRGDEDCGLLWQARASA